MSAPPIEEVEESLRRIQEFDSSKLAQREKLGGELSFEKAVQPTDRIISLFKKIPVTILDQLSTAMLQQIKQQADTFYSELDEILSFSSNQENPGPARKNLIERVRNRYDSVFPVLHPIIAYAISQTVDFQNLEDKGRAAVQSIQDRAETLQDDLNKQKSDAENILADIRRTAAEQGVSQEAHWFKREADKHETMSKGWKRATLAMAVILALYTAVFFVWHPDADASLAETIQFISTKLLIFFTLAFLLFTAARVYAANNHNCVVNRHRQNALQTFQALVDATVSPEAQDVVLNHAASCIFSPQETAFSKTSNSQNPGVNISMMEMFLRRGISGGGDGA